ncbi:MAG: hypothetical protein JHD35_04220 [Sphingopyxis sp.]|nr:hypothetical protein [Sphingopyxis sp.]
MTIKLLYQSSLSRAQIEQLGDALRPLDADISISEVPDPDPQNVLEWALPFGLGILLAGPVKSATDGFFGEMGKDAYQKLKEVISRLFQEAKNKGMSWKSRNGDVRRAPPLAIMFEIDGDSLRFVFPHDLMAEKLPSALEEMNRDIAFIANMVTWQKKQFALMDDHAIDLLGPSYPEQDRWLQNRQLLDEIAFGTWVYNSTANSWIKVQ